MPRNDPTTRHRKPNTIDQRQQQIDRRVEVETAKPIWPLTIPDLIGRFIAPRPDHGIYVLRDAVNGKPNAQVNPGAQRAAGARAPSP